MQLVRTVPNQAAGEAFRQGSWSRCFLTQVFEERLLLLAGQELVVTGDRVEQDLRVAIVQVGASQEVGADHLQTVSARFVRPQHQGCRLDRLLDDWDLALIDFEVDQFRRLLFPSRQLLLHCPPEVLFRQGASFVQPGCTIEVLTVPARDLRQLQPLRPSHLSQILPSLRRQVLVDGHQVVGFPSRFRKPPCQELVKRLQVFEPPVLPCPHLAQIPAKLDETSVALCVFLLLPGQDLVDLGEDKQGSLAIELGGHRHRPKTKVRQTDQDRLPACARVRPQLCRAYRGRARRMGRLYTDSAESGCRYAAGTAQIRFVALCLRREFRTPAAAGQKWWPGRTELRPGACARKQSGRLRRSRSSTSSRRVADPVRKCRTALPDIGQRWSSIPERRVCRP